MVTLDIFCEYTREYANTVARFEGIAAYGSELRLVAKTTTFTSVVTCGVLGADAWVLSSCTKCMLTGHGCLQPWQVRDGILACLQDA